jgi:ribulose-phosphate 3-epimerase
MAQLAPSILSADFSKLGEDVKAIQEAGADLIHVDVMDGHFVPNISFGATVMKSLLGKATIPFDVHLMIENPDKYLEDFNTDNTEYITVHAEACPHINRTISHIKSLGIKAGVAINPGTSLSVLDYVIEDADMILIMSVNPGFGGQKFIPSAMNKAKELQSIKESRNLDFKIEIDGGITTSNVKEVVESGVEIIVAGSSVFGAPDIDGRVKEFKDIIK